LILFVNNFDNREKHRDFSSQWANSYPGMALNEPKNQRSKQKFESEQKESIIDVFDIKDVIEKLHRDFSSKSEAQIPSQNLKN